MIIPFVDFARQHGRVKVRHSEKLGRTLLLCRDDEDNEVYINPPREGSRLTLTLVDFSRTPEDVAIMIKERKHELAVFIGDRNWDDPDGEEIPTYILIDRERIINQTCVTTVIENNGRLGRKDYPIPSCELTIGEMNDIVENPNMTFMDLQSYFLSHYIIRRKSFNCCMPNEYDSFFIDEIEVPSKITYQEYKKLVNENVKNSRYNSAEMEEDDIETNLAEYEIELKNKYFQKYQNVIRAYLLNQKTLELQKDNNIKMYSTENIGWTNFVYPINTDVVVSVSTNFGYGKDAYLNLTVKYKNIILIPYSYAIKYKYANFYDLISCTRAYIPKRENWDVAFDFVVDFVNKSMDNPKKFVFETIMHEIEFLMSGLKRLMNSSEEELRNMYELPRDDREQTTIRVIQPPMEYRAIKRIEDIYPSEFITIFKAEKISGALSFVESFEEFAKYCPVVRKYIIQIERYNNLIIPELENVRSNIEKRKKEIIQNKHEIVVELESIEEQIQPYKVQLEEKKKGKNRNERTAIERKFESDNPVYRRLLKKWEKKDGEKNKLEQNYRSQKYMIDAINDINSTMAGYFTAL